MVLYLHIQSLHQAHVSPLHAELLSNSISSKESEDPQGTGLAMDICQDLRGHPLCRIVS